MWYFSLFLFSSKKLPGKLQADCLTDRLENQRHKLSQDAAITTREQSEELECFSLQITNVQREQTVRDFCVASTHLRSSTFFYGKHVFLAVTGVRFWRLTVLFHIRYFYAEPFDEEILRWLSPAADNTTYYIRDPLGCGKLTAAFDLEEQRHTTFTHIGIHPRVWPNSPISMRTPVSMASPCAVATIRENVPHTGSRI